MHFEGDMEGRVCSADSLMSLYRMEREWQRSGRGIELERQPVGQKQKYANDTEYETPPHRPDQVQREWINRLASQNTAGSAREVVHQTYQSAHSAAGILTTVGKQVERQLQLFTEQIQQSVAPLRPAHPVMETSECRWGQEREKVEEKRRTYRSSSSSSNDGSEPVLSRTRSSLRKTLRDITRVAAAAQITLTGVRGYLLVQKPARPIITGNRKAQS